MRFDKCMEEFQSTFIWWYCDHYNLTLDPFAMWSFKQAKRVVEIHCMFSGKDLEIEFLRFVFNARDYQLNYDSFANFDFEKVEKFAPWDSIKNVLDL